MQRPSRHNLDPVVLRQLEHHVIVDEVQRSVQRVDRHVRRPIQLDLGAGGNFTKLSLSLSLMKIKQTSEMGIVPTQGRGFQVAR